MLKNKKIIFADKNGQSIVEFLIFLPLIIILFLTMITIVGSINGSINQLKALRGYFFFRTKSNGKLPAVQDFEAFRGAGVETLGVHTLGWMDYPIREIAVAPCYSLQSLITTQADDTCEDAGSVRGRDAKSKFIRSYTVYGICSAHVLRLNQKDDYSDMSSLAWSSGYCTRK